MSIYINGSSNASRSIVFFDVTFSIVIFCTLSVPPSGPEVIKLFFFIFQIKISKPHNYGNSTDILKMKV